MKNIFKMLAVAVLFFLPLCTHAEPKVNLLPGMSDQVFVNEGIMNPTKLLKVGDKFYFFNLGSRQNGVFLDIYDSSMKLSKHVQISEFTNKEVKITYNKDKKNFGILWRVGIPGLLYYRFLDLSGNFLTDRVQLGLDSKIGNDLIVSIQASDWAYDQDGNYLAVWTGLKSTDWGTSNSCVFAQRITSDFKLSGPSFSLNDCNAQTSEYLGRVFSFKDKYFIYLSFVEDYGKSTQKVKSYYNILKTNFTQADTQASSSQWKIISTDLKGLPINNILADQSSVYFLLIDQSKSSDRSVTLKLVKLNLATEKFSDVYIIGTSLYFSSMPLLVNNKIYLTAIWANMFEPSTNYHERAKTFFIVFDLNTNKAQWTMLLDQPSLNSYKIELEDIDNTKLYFYRSYRELTHSTPIYGYLTTINESLLASSRSPLLNFQMQQTAIVDKILVAKLSGKILLQVESHGEAWYVNPKDGAKYYMANGDAAYNLMKRLGVGISNKNLDKIKADKNYAKKFSGNILLQVESKGEAYYIDFKGSSYYLKNGTAAYEVMRKLGLGVTNSDLNKIDTGNLSF